MLSIVEGNVFDQLRPGDIFVHGCNCMGAFGRGVAQDVKHKWPEAYHAYKSSVRGYRLGEYSMVFIPYDDIFVVNALTQQFYGSNKSIVYADYDAIRKVFVDISTVAISFLPSSRIVFPFVGAGLANGDKIKLLSIFEDVFDTEESPEGVLVVQLE